MDRIKIGAYPALNLSNLGFQAGVFLEALPVEMS